MNFGNYFVFTCHVNGIFNQKSQSSLTLSAPIPQNTQTHSNNSSTVVDELLECFWSFCGVGA